MHLHAELRLVVILAATVAGCDVDEPSLPTEEEIPDAGAPRISGPLEYQGRDDRDDFAVLHDRSNLRRRELSLLDYRRWLSRRDREEVLHDIEGAVLPTEEEIASVSMRWFVTG